MANDCYYIMKVKGTKDNCYKWLNKMKSYDEPDHFFRIFSVDITEEGGTDEEYCMTFEGDCAWSLETCCRALGYSNGVDLFAVNSKNLNIVTEAYSEEIGMCFQEHYIYNRGICVKADCVDWEGYYYDESRFKSFDDFKETFNLPNDLTEADLNEGFYYSGGFETWDFSI